MDPAQFYSFKVWLTMVIIAPVLQILVSQFFFHSGSILSVAFIKEYPLSVGVLMVFTCPLGALLTFIIPRMTRNSTVIAVKQRVSAALGMVVILVFLGASAAKNAYSPFELSAMLLPFLFPLLLGVWICRLDLEDESYEDEEEEEPAS
ncbi:hypothetical protein PQ469_17960 [Mucilaginibacter sp. KACC 22773]|uniref:hypothetical protein n=1 Tax=Mucilaginibacter sp. KACC 22773 TaxID=3025671 RepID=UPI002366FE20|nr:hypothetical protein [Mucilaginibacter sp. KACC 22773]WDF75774.1 hypothetical protein PQ469_17960 [Mucilaginibacter sp. KACC 22773]